jgi:hypothetical protein
LIGFKSACSCQYSASDADTNKDGKITLGEIQAYLIENVSRQAEMMGRKQEPQLVGDARVVLVGR